MTSKIIKIEDLHNHILVNCVCFPNKMYELAASELPEGREVIFKNAYS